MDEGAATAQLVNKRAGCFYPQIITEWNGLNYANVTHVKTWWWLLLENLRENLFENNLTLARCELIHFVNVLFWTNSCSSGKEEKRKGKYITRVYFCQIVMETLKAYHLQQARTLLDIFAVHTENQSKDCSATMHYFHRSKYQTFTLH